LKIAEWCDPQALTFSLVLFLFPEFQAISYLDLVAGIGWGVIMPADKFLGHVLLIDDMIFETMGVLVAFAVSEILR
jgi:hypothetical protein